MGEHDSFYQFLPGPVREPDVKVMRYAICSFWLLNFLATI